MPEANFINLVFISVSKKLKMILRKNSDWINPEESKFLERALSKAFHCPAVRLTVSADRQKHAAGLVRR